MDEFDDDNDDLKIVDPEFYQSNKDKQFNYQTLIMNSYTKVIEAGSCEMRTGYMNKREDRRGNLIITYVDDTQKKFIECVKTLINLIVAHYDDVASEKINEKLTYLDELKKKLLKEQSIFWESLSGAAKNKAIQEGNGVIDGYLNASLPYHKFYIDEQVEVYRKVFMEINLLIKRKNFFSEEMFIG